MQSTPESPDFFIEIGEATDAGETVVRICGDVDMTNAEELDRVVRDQMRRSPVLLDLRRVTFMDSSGLRALDSLVRHSRAGGGELRVDARLSASVHQILELTGLMQILPLAEPDARR